MEGAINQAKHNQDFHELISQSCGDKFFDWRITCLFYIVHHAFQALADHRGVKLGDRHTDILQNMNPKNPKRTLQIKSDVFYAYDALFQYSWKARYDGFTNFEVFQELMKADYTDALRRFEYLKKYVQESGVNI